jgi:curved DNA-binding protein CbpA
LINYYKILNINIDAAQSEIKEQYKRLAKFYHPKNNLGAKIAEEKYTEILAAYEILSNPKKRAEYDFVYFNKIKSKKSYLDIIKVVKKGLNPVTAYIIIILIVVLTILFSSNKKTTTGNSAADKLLEQQKETRPETGEIDFNSK